MYEKIKGGRIAQSVNPKAAVSPAGPSARPALVRTHSNKQLRTLSAPKQHRFHSCSHHMLLGWQGPCSMLSSLRTQVNTILPVAGGCHISLAQASRGATPSFRGAGHAFPPWILQEKNPDICEQP